MGSRRQITRWPHLILLIACLAITPAAHAQLAALPHADTTETASFGSAVAIDGDRAAVGASGEDECGPNSGAVYLFERPEGGGVTSWQKTGRITPSDCREGAFFGRDIDLSGDHLVVSSTVEFFAQEEPHVAYIFERAEDGTWHEASQLSADVAGGSFASSVTIVGNRTLITSEGRSGGGTNQHGTAYIFEKDLDTGNWLRKHTFHGMHRGNWNFGAMGAMHGSTIAVTAPATGGRTGGIHIFEENNGRWRETQYIDGYRDEYLTIALGEGQLAVGDGVAGSQGEGQVSIYQKEEEGSWRRIQTLRPDLPYDQGSFGMNLAMNGPRLLITGYDEQLRFEFNIDRVVYVFNRENGAWQQRHIIDIGQVDFGTDIDFDGNTAIVGHASKRSPAQAYVVKVH